MPPSIRWAFNVSKWDPSEKEFLLASSCLQLEEKIRIGKFVFKKDLKASLVGRLLIRKFISEKIGLPYNSIKLLRDKNNKPIFNNVDSNVPEVTFNVSHHGSYTVLAGEVANTNIGVDVMKLEYSGGKSLEDFFRIMNRNFSALEWRKIRGTPTTPDQDKIATFCRNWALKESYVKGIGKGLSIGLTTLDFDIISSLQEDKVTLDSSLYINGEKQQWIFEESLIDSCHCVSVALEQKYYQLNQLNSCIFEILTPEELLKGAIPILAEDLDYYKKYYSKK